MFSKIRLISIVCLLVILGNSARAEHGQYTYEQLLQAIREVETGGQPNNGEFARGDSGAAIGPFQIHKAYWKDADLPGNYSDCNTYSYSLKVVKSYMNRYAKEAINSRNWEKIARTHNGGINVYKNPKTLAYWRKVQQKLQKNN